MKRILIAATAVLALAACNKKTDATAASDTGAASGALTSTPSSTAPDGTPLSSAAPAAASPPAAPDFVAMAAASDMYEVQAAKIAQKKSKNADVKAFAAMMITDHGKSTAMIKKAVADSGRTDITPPTALPADKQAMIDVLNSASPADFDKTYVDQQVTAHKDALGLMTAYSTGGDTPQLKDAAGMIVPVVQMHLDHITTIQASLAK